MTEMLMYLLEAAICVTGMFLLYRLGLGRMSHFGWNRFFLVAGLFGAMAIPLLEIPVSWEYVQPQEKESRVVGELSPVLSEALGEEMAVLSTTKEISTVPEFPVAKVIPVEKTPLTWQFYLTALWGAGAGLVLLKLLWRLFSLGQKRLRFPRETIDGMQISLLPSGQGTFSFLGWIFLQKSGIPAEDRRLVIAHERAHGRYLHSLDNLMLEMASAVLWFHPLIYRWRKELHAVHEYQVDAAVAATTDPVAYSRLILRLSQPRRQPHPAHAFSQSKAGQRIEMLHHLPSHPMSKLKYLLSLPLISLFLLAFTIVPAEYEYSGPLDHSSAFEYTFADEVIPMHLSHVNQKLGKQMEGLKANPKRAALAIDRAEMWRGTIVGILKEEGVPTDFFYMAMAESMLDPVVESPYGAKGMWQFMPKTATHCGLTINDKIDQRLNPLRATKAACRYLREMYAETGTWTAAASAYNRGLPGYQKYLAKYNAKSYFAAQGEDAYLYRIVAFKRLIEEPSAFGQRRIPARDAGNPPSAVPLGGPYEISSGFGLRKHPDSGKQVHHNGIDLKAASGTRVLAPANATVLAVMKNDAAYGNHLLLRHDGTFTTKYAHLSEITVKEGQILKRGDVIGKVGATGRATGPHLHYEVLENGQQVDPRRYFLPRKGGYPTWKKSGFMRYMKNDLNGGC